MKEREDSKEKPRGIESWSQTGCQVPQSDLLVSPKTLLVLLTSHSVLCTSPETTIVSLVLMMMTGCFFSCSLIQSTASLRHLPLDEGKTVAGILVIDTQSVRDTERKLLQMKHVVQTEMSCVTDSSCKKVMSRSKQVTDFDFLNEQQCIAMSVFDARQ